MLGADRSFSVGCAPGGRRPAPGGRTWPPPPSEEMVPARRRAHVNALLEAKGLAMDLDAFECPICLSLFQGSIYQCKNGHVVCDACLVRIRGGICPSCGEPVGDIRCRALESALAGMALPCSFSSHGCTQLLRDTERRDHEGLLCRHAPLACPFQGCAYAGQRLYDHVQDAHSYADYVVSFGGGSEWWVSLRRSRPFMALLDPVDRSVYLLLNGGGSLSVVCLGPRPAGSQLPLEHKYKLKVRGGGARELSLSALVPCMRSWAGQHPAGALLVVPDAYWAASFNSDSLVVHVRVKKKSSSSTVKVNNAGTSLGTCYSMSKLRSRPSMPKSRHVLETFSTSLA